MAAPAQLVGQSVAFLDTIEAASRAAPLDRPVLVIGERGTGKELIAERLHRLSTRWSQPLVIMNCAALPESLVDAELFGHEAGAFTGATRARAGRFEEADGGTLFLDEIGTLTMPAQERLLRVVEYGELVRVGASKPTQVDVRLVGATNVDLPGLVRAGRFRADLLDRLSFEVITLPPLRARGEDVMVLAEHFGRRMAAELGWERFPGFSDGARSVLAGHAWPGNVRELRNVVERACYRSGREDTPIARIELDPFESPWRPAPEIAAPAAGAEGDAGAGPPNGSTGAAPPIPTAAAGLEADFRTAVQAYERALLERALAKARHNQRAAASALGLTYDQFRHCLKKHGLLERSAA